MSVLAVGALLACGIVGFGTVAGVVLWLVFPRKGNR